MMKRDSDIMTQSPTQLNADASYLLIGLTVVKLILVND